MSIAWGIEVKYNIDVQVTESVVITVNNASCVEHAKELAEQMIKQDYPDAYIEMTHVEVVDD